MERQVYPTLVRDSKNSQSSLQRLFRQYLLTAPEVKIRSKSHVHILIDGTYFSNGLCLILYYDHDIRYVQLYRETNKEKMRDIREDLQNLKVLGVDIYSVTCDGHKSILSAVARVYPDAIIQRCLVHIKRQVKNYLSEHPKHPGFKRWYDENQAYINEKSINQETGWDWFTHKNLHLATSLIINAIPNMFHYLDDSAIPNTTNRLESYFTHLKEKLTLHRGLRLPSRKNFIKWYLYFKNQHSK